MVLKQIRKKKNTNYEIYEAEHNNNKACTTVKRGYLFLNPNIYMKVKVLARPLKKCPLNKKERKENLPSYLSIIFSSFPEQNPCTSS